MSATIIIRTDEDVKKACDALYKRLGLNLSSAINAFLKASLRTNGLPFQLIDEQAYFSDETLEAIKEGDRIAKDPKAKGYKAMKDLWKSLGV